MSEFDTSVETQEQGVQDDAVLKPVQEETEPITPIAELEEKPQEEAPPQKEPGWIRQRIDKAVSKAIAETEARMQAEFDQRLAPIRESMYERQADELVSSGEFKTRERALEYVRLKNGVVEPAPKPEQPRDEQGRFSAENATSKARAELLARQAQKIRDNRGLDVMGAFNQDESIKQKVVSGEWDFYDVADAMSRTSKRVPAPVRSPNGGENYSGVSIMNMTDAQFRKLQENLASGKVYDAR
jgi:hypothetical protein